MTLLCKILHSHRIVRALRNFDKQHAIIGIVGAVCVPSEFMELRIEEVPQNGPNTLQGHSHTSLTPFSN
jgi:hypothetical protein